MTQEYARVAELADALDSGSSVSNNMWVQVPSLRAIRKNRVTRSYGLVTRFCYTIFNFTGYKNSIWR